MGPNCFAVFDECVPVLRGLRKAGMRLGVISDWQKGLTHFCEELGIGHYLDVVVASSEVGYQKPNRRLFQAAQERLGVAAADILHVGDRDEDVQGAQAAGFSAALLLRAGAPRGTEAPVLKNLHELISLVERTI